MACNGRYGDAYFDTIVSDRKLELKHFDHMLVEFVDRSANCVAHLLATAAHSYVWPWRVALSLLQSLEVMY